MNLKKYNFKNFQIVKNASSKELDVYIDGEISDEEWWGDEITPKQIRETLEENDNSQMVNLHINSFGGSVWAGNFIIDIFENYKRKTNATINAYISFAASMATGIAMVADNIYMYDNGMFMVHKPSGMAWGNEYDLAKTIEVLQKCEETLITNYKRKFKGEEETLRQLLADESWLTASEALEYGFIDEIIEPIKVVASAKGYKIGNVLYGNKEIINKLDKMVEKLNIVKEEEIEMKYSKILNEKFSINEEKFKDLTPEELIELVENATKEPFKDLIDDEGNVIKLVQGEEFDLTNYIDKSVLAEKLNLENVSEEEIVALVEKGKDVKEVDPQIENKAKQFETIFNKQVDNTITSGIKAMGVENFAEDTWRKALSTMSFEDVENMQTTWETQAKLILNAGVQVSKNGVIEIPLQNNTNNTNKQKVDVKDLDF